MFIKQISVFLENVNGALCELTHMLGKGGIDLMALSIADTQNFGIVRIIVADAQIDPALAILRQNGFTCRVNNVVCAVVEDRPLGLCEMLESIESEGISVEYLYSFMCSTGDKIMMIFRLSDQDESVKLLEKKGVQLVSQEEIDRL